MVVEFWDPRYNEQIFGSWKDKNWWQSQAPGENVEDFMADINSRKITKNDNLDKLKWGYSNTENFNPKEALSLVTGN